MRISTAMRLAKRLVTHETARYGLSLRPLLRFAGWQLRKHIWDRPVQIRAFDTGRLLCYPDNSASNAVVYFGWPDWNEMSWLKEVLRPGDGFVDAGANVGVYSVLAATRVMPKGRVAAIEPEPSVADRLVENFELNGLDPRDVWRVALGERNGRVRFSTGNDTSGRVVEGMAGERGESIPVRRLDDLLGSQAEDLTVGKMDLEGYELQAFLGATSLLEKRRPRAWLVETNRRCEAYGTTRAELQALLEDYGFRLYEMRSGGHLLVPIPAGGPYPANALALGDASWLQRRHQRLRFGRARS